MKKILLLCFLCFSLVALLGVTAHAEELPASATTDATPAPDALPAEDSAQTSPLGNFLQSAGNTLFALAALVGSLLISLLYKTGAISSVRTGLSSLEALLGKSREATEECSSLVHTLEDRIAALELACGERDGACDTPATITEDAQKDPATQVAQPEEA